MIAQAGHGVKKVERGHLASPDDMQKSMPVREKADDRSVHAVYILVAPVLMKYFPDSPCCKPPVLCSRTADVASLCTK